MKQSVQPGLESYVQLEKFVKCEVYDIPCDPDASQTHEYPVLYINRPKYDQAEFHKEPTAQMCGVAVAKVLPLSLHMVADNSCPSPIESQSNEWAS